MPNDLAIFDQPTKALSLPDFLVRLQLGEVKWPGQPARKYLAGNTKLTSTQQLEAAQHMDALADALSPQGDMGSKARAVLLMKMLLGLGGQALTERMAEAKAEAYRDAVGDLPPWAIHEAIRRWHRGECGEHNYAFPPAPALLREVTESILAPYRTAFAKAEAAANAMTIDRALDPKPIDRNKSIIPRFRVV
jgi:hypothetical protein